MKDLLIVKAGDYDPERHTVTHESRRQLARLGTAIRRLANGSSIHIISSSSCSSVETAKELAAILNAGFEVHPYLQNFHNEKFPKSYNKATHIIDSRRKRADTLIIIGNGYAIEAMVPYAAFKYLDKPAFAGVFFSSTGVHIGLEQKVLEKIGANGNNNGTGQAKPLAYSSAGMQ